MLTIQSVSKIYPGGAHALSNVSLDIDAAEIVAVIGGSGCGKSTLLRLVAGLDRPSSGRVLIDHEPISAPHPAVGVVFQEPRLFPWLTVAQNVGFGLSGASKPQQGARVAAALQRVGLADHARRWPRQLSGGQAQRVALARALAPQPRALLLDEPFSALDAFTRADLQDHLLSLWDELRPTLLLVTHDIEEALVLADRVVVMQSRPGRIAAVLPIALPRPRDRISPEFDELKREALRILGHSWRAPPHAIAAE
ncbi:ABC transporter ATP-binding protein [Methylocella silvestris]|uniref:Nitrate/sulfonate/bicarbonate ABC transporter ATP-binding protein n=1 Tax=Methylocella silvestris TaxID=199596 RepID=A0A2J7TEP7_METSI|nr:ABC transporter ATP-binding protein [Methylocella silvestris]PNG25237.1 nitrate/sulfonate/bicarbonate ABC transporter ATP-binding protein [Methylocella silvestris]